jgi:hypothetical protein
MIKSVLSGFASLLFIPPAFSSPLGFRAYEEALDRAGDRYCELRDRGVGNIEAGSKAYIQFAVELGAPYGADAVDTLALIKRNPEVRKKIHGDYFETLIEKCRHHIRPD